MSSILFLFILFLVFTGLFSTTASASSSEEKKAEKGPHFCTECGSEIFDEEDGETHQHNFHFHITAVGNSRQMRWLRRNLASSPEGSAF